MKRFESIVLPTENEKRLSIFLLFFAGGFIFFLVGIVEYFVHGNQWGWPDKLVGSLLFIGVIGMVVGSIAVMLDYRKGKTWLIIHREPDGLHVQVTGKDRNYRLLSPFEWTRWQSLKSIGEYDKCIVDNVVIRNDKGEWLGFRESLMDQTTPAPFVRFRKERVEDDVRVYEVMGIGELIAILEKEAWDGFREEF